MAEVRTFEYPNCIVRVHMPELTEDERTKRINQLKKATAIFMKAVEKERRSGEFKKKSNQPGNQCCNCDSDCVNSIQSMES